LEIKERHSQEFQVALSHWELGFVKSFDFLGQGLEEQVDHFQFSDFWF
jgi:hypothetical protein